MGRYYDKRKDKSIYLHSCFNSNTQAKRQAIVANKVSADNVYKALVYFDKYVVDMTDAECREFITQLIEKVEVYEERQLDNHIKLCARNQI